MFGNEEGHSLPGKENERFVGRRETGMSVGMSLDGEQMKSARAGAARWAPSGRWGEWSQTGVKKGSCGDWREKPGSGRRKGAS